MFRTFALVCVVALVAIALGGCGDDGGETPASATGKPVVYTTFYPTTYFAERIAGDRADVVCPVPPDEDAIFWKPPPEVVTRYQRADLIVVNGAEFEKWVAKTSLPEARVVDSARAFEDDLIRFEHAVTHSHGPAGAHAHVGIDGHTWLDPENAIVQAGEVEKGLERVLPDAADALRVNLAALVADLRSLDTAIRAAREAYDGHAILASHPAYNYLARRYDLKIVNLSLDPGEMPDDATFRHVADAVRTTNAHHILWEGEPLPEIAARFRDELGLESVVFSPCELMEPADLAAGEDYLTVMRANVERLAPVLAARGD